MWVLNRLVEYLRIGFHPHKFAIGLQRLKNLIVLHGVKGLLLPLLLHTAGFGQNRVALVDEVRL